MITDVNPGTEQPNVRTIMASATKIQLITDTKLWNTKNKAGHNNFFGLKKHFFLKTITRSMRQLSCKGQTGVSTVFINIDTRKQCPEVR